VAQQPSVKRVSTIGAVITNWLPCAVHSRLVRVTMTVAS
jgi:hypothetical protein